MTLILGVFVLASASAQDAVFLVGSTHKASFALNTGNTCEWNVYKVNDFADQKDAVLADNDKLNDDDDFLFVGDVNNAANIDVTWMNPGKYYLIVEEFNAGGDCSTRRPIAIEVVAGATVQFALAASNDCSDVGNSFTTSIVVNTNGIADNKFFPITVNYRLPGDAADRTVTVEDDKLMTVLGLSIIDEYTESNHIVTIFSAKDKYGGDINIETTGGVNKHTRTLYAIPEISPITIK